MPPNALAPIPVSAAKMRIRQRQSHHHPVQPEPRPENAAGTRRRAQLFLQDLLETPRPAEARPRRIRVPVAPQRCSAAMDAAIDISRRASIRARTLTRACSPRNRARNSRSYATQGNRLKVIGGVE